MKKSHSTFKRIVSFVVTISLVTTNVGWSLPTNVGAEFLRPPVQNTSGEKTSPLHIDIPSELGMIRHLYLSEHGDGIPNRFVIYIHDAHADLEAQKRIADLIEHFQKELGIKTILAEGASGEGDLTAFQVFRDRDVTKKVAEKFLETAELTGFEYAAITSQSPLRLIGLEDPELYQKHFSAFLANNQVREENKKTLAKLANEIEQAKKKVYNKRLYEFDSVIASPGGAKQSQSSQIASASLGTPPRNDVIELIPYVARTARNLGIDFDRFTSIRTVLRIQILEGLLNLPWLTSDKTQRERYVAKLNELQETMEPGNLMEEFKSLTKSVKEALFRNEKERRLDQRSEEINLFLHLSELQLGPDEWNEYQKRVTTGKTVGLDPAEEFYNLAGLRDEALAKNLIQELRHTDRAFLITGGFHGPALEKAMEDAGISFVSIYPHISGRTDAKRYVDRMLADAGQPVILNTYPSYPFPQHTLIPRLLTFDVSFQKRFAESVDTFLTAEDAPGLPGVSGAVPARGFRPRAGGGDAERSRPLIQRRTLNEGVVPSAGSFGFGRKAKPENTKMLKEKKRGKSKRVNVFSSPATLDPLAERWARDVDGQTSISNQGRGSRPFTRSDENSGFGAENIDSLELAGKLIHTEGFAGFHLDLIEIDLEEQEVAGREFVSKWFRPESGRFAVRVPSGGKVYMGLRQERDTGGPRPTAFLYISDRSMQTLVVPVGYKQSDNWIVNSESAETALWASKKILGDQAKPIQFARRRIFYRISSADIPKNVGDSIGLHLQEVSVGFGAIQQEALPLSLAEELRKSLIQMSMWNDWREQFVLLRELIAYGVHPELFSEFPSKVSQQEARKFIFAQATAETKKKVLSEPPEAYLFFPMLPEKSLVEWDYQSRISLHVDVSDAVINILGLEYFVNRHPIEIPYDPEKAVAVQMKNPQYVRSVLEIIDAVMVGADKKWGEEELQVWEKNKNTMRNVITDLYRKNRKLFDELRTTFNANIHPDVAQRSGTRSIDELMRNVVPEDKEQFSVELKRYYGAMRRNIDAFYLHHIFFPVDYASSNKKSRIPFSISIVPPLMRAVLGLLDKKGRWFEVRTGTGLFKEKSRVAFALFPANVRRLSALFNTVAQEFQHGYQERLKKDQHRELYEVLLNLGRQEGGENALDQLEQLLSFGVHFDLQRRLPADVYSDVEMGDRGARNYIFAQMPKQDRLNTFGISDQDADEDLQDQMNSFLFFPLLSENGQFAALQDYQRKLSKDSAVANALLSALDIDLASRHPAGIEIVTTEEMTVAGPFGIFAFKQKVKKTTQVMVVGVKMGSPQFLSDALRVFREAREGIQAEREAHEEDLWNQHEDRIRRVLEELYIKEQPLFNSLYDTFHSGLHHNFYHDLGIDSQRRMLEAVVPDDMKHFGNVPSPSNFFFFPEHYIDMEGNTRAHFELIDTSIREILGIQDDGEFHFVVELNANSKPHPYKAEVLRVKYSNNHDRLLDAFSDIAGFGTNYDKPVQHLNPAGQPDLSTAPIFEGLRKLGQSPRQGFGAASIHGRGGGMANDLSDWNRDALRRLAGGLPVELTRGQMGLMLAPADLKVFSQIVVKSVFESGSGKNGTDYKRDEQRIELDIFGHAPRINIEARTKFQDGSRHDEDFFSEEMVRGQKPHWKHRVRLLSFQWTRNRIFYINRRVSPNLKVKITAVLAGNGTEELGSPSAGFGSEEAKWDLEKVRKLTPDKLLSRIQWNPETRGWSKGDTLHRRNTLEFLLRYYKDKMREFWKLVENVDGKYPKDVMAAFRYYMGLANGVVRSADSTSEILFQQGITKHRLERTIIRKIKVPAAIQRLFVAALGSSEDAYQELSRLPANERPRDLNRLLKRLEENQVALKALLNANQPKSRDEMDERVDKITKGLPERLRRLVSNQPEGRAKFTGRLRRERIVTAPDQYLSENNPNIPSIAIVVAFAQELGVSIDRLLDTQSYQVESVSLIRNLRPKNPAERARYLNGISSLSRAEQEKLTGLHVDTIVRFEKSGDSARRLETFLKLSFMYGISPGQLMGSVETGDLKPKPAPVRRVFRANGIEVESSSVSTNSVNGAGNEFAMATVRLKPDHPIALETIPGKTVTFSPKQLSRFSRIVVDRKRGKSEASQEKVTLEVEVKSRTADRTRIDRIHISAAAYHFSSGVGESDDWGEELNPASKPWKGNPRHPLESFEVLWSNRDLSLTIRQLDPDAKVYFSVALLEHGDASAHSVPPPQGFGVSETVAKLLRGEAVQFKPRQGPIEFTLEELRQFSGIKVKSIDQIRNGRIGMRFRKQSVEFAISGQEPSIHARIEVDLWQVLHDVVRRSTPLTFEGEIKQGTLVWKGEEGNELLESLHFQWTSSGTLYIVRTSNPGLEVTVTAKSASGFGAEETAANEKVVASPLDHRFVSLPEVDTIEPHIVVPYGDSLYFQGFIRDETPGKYPEWHDAQQDVVLALDLNSIRLDLTKFSGSGRLSLSRSQLHGDYKGTIAVTDGAVYFSSGQHINHYDGINYKGPDADLEPVDVFISAFSVITGLPDTSKFDQGELNFTKLTGEWSGVPLLVAQDDVLYAAAQFPHGIRIYALDAKSGAVRTDLLKNGVVRLDEKFLNLEGFSLSGNALLVQTHMSDDALSAFDARTGELIEPIAGLTHLYNLDERPETQRKGLKNLVVRLGPRNEEVRINSLGIAGTPGGGFYAMDEETLYIDTEQTEPKFYQGRRVRAIALNRKTGRIDETKFERGALLLEKEQFIRQFLIRGSMLYLLGEDHRRFGESKALIGAVNLSKPFAEFNAAASGFGAAEKKMSERAEAKWRKTTRNLIARYRLGDKQEKDLAMREFIDHIRPLVLSTVKRYGGNLGNGVYDQIKGDVALQVVETFPDNKGGNISAWIYWAVRSALLSLRRAGKRTIGRGTVASLSSGSDVDSQRSDSPDSRVTIQNLLSRIDLASKKRSNSLMKQKAETLRFLLSYADNDPERLLNVVHGLLIRNKRVARNVMAFSLVYGLNDGEAHSLKEAASILFEWGYADKVLSRERISKLANEGAWIVFEELVGGARKLLAILHEMEPGEFPEPFRPPDHRVMKQIVKRAKIERSREGKERRKREIEKRRKYRNDHKEEINKHALEIERDGGHIRETFSERIEALEHGQIKGAAKRKLLDYVRKRALAGRLPASSTLIEYSKSTALSIDELLGTKTNRSKILPKGWQRMNQGDRISTLRRAKDLDRVVLAELSGLSSVDVRLIEQNTITNLHFRTYIALSLALSISPGQLLEGLPEAEKGRGFGAEGASAGVGDGWSQIAQLSGYRNFGEVVYHDGHYYVEAQKPGVFGVVLKVSQDGHVKEIDLGKYEVSRDYPVFFKGNMYIVARLRNKVTQEDFLEISSSGVKKIDLGRYRAAAVLPGENKIYLFAKRPESEIQDFDVPYIFSFDSSRKPSKVSIPRSQLKGYKYFSGGLSMVHQDALYISAVRKPAAPFKRPDSWEDMPGKEGSRVYLKVNLSGDKQAQEIKLGRDYYHFGSIISDGKHLYVDGFYQRGPQKFDRATEFVRIDPSGKTKPLKTRIELPTHTPMAWHDGKLHFTAGGDPSLPQPLLMRRLASGNVEQADIEGLEKIKAITSTPQGLLMIGESEEGPVLARLNTDKVSWSPVTDLTDPTSGAWPDELGGWSGFGVVADLDYLRHKWDELMRAVQVSGLVGDIWDDLVKHYSAKDRYYHNLFHIESMLRELEESGVAARDIYTLEFAIWFHDVIYDSRRKDNEEKSAEYAERALQKLSLSETFISVVRKLILVTKDHQPEVGNADAELISDLDLAILGASRADYDRYEEAIGQEYRWVNPRKAFYQGRAAFLGELLRGGKAIYRGHYFRGKYAAQATVNLRRTIARLKNTSGFGAVGTEIVGRQLSDGSVSSTTRKVIPLPQSPTFQSLYKLENPHQSPLGGFGGIKIHPPKNMKNTTNPSTILTGMEVSLNQREAAPEPESTINKLSSVEPTFSRLKGSSIQNVPFDFEGDLIEGGASISSDSQIVNRNVINNQTLPAGFGTDAWDEAALRAWFSEHVPDGAKMIETEAFRERASQIITALNNSPAGTKINKKTKAITPHFEALGIPKPSKLISGLLKSEPAIHIDPHIAIFVPGTKIFLLPQEVFLAVIFSQREDEIYKEKRKTSFKEIRESSLKDGLPQAFAPSSDIPDDQSLRLYEMLRWFSGEDTSLDLKWLQENEQSIIRQIKHVFRKGSVFMDLAEITDWSMNEVRHRVGHELFQIQILDRLRMIRSGKPRNETLYQRLERFYAANQSSVASLSRDSTDYGKSFERADWLHILSEILAQAYFSSDPAIGGMKSDGTVYLAGRSQGIHGRKTAQILQIIEESRNLVRKEFPFTQEIFNRVLGETNKVLERIQDTLSTLKRESSLAGFGAASIVISDVASAIQNGELTAEAILKLAKENPRTRIHLIFSEMESWEHAAEFIEAAFGERAREIFPLVSIHTAETIRARSKLSLSAKPERLKGAILDQLTLQAKGRLVVVENMETADKSQFSARAENVRRLVIESKSGISHPNLLSKAVLLSRWNGAERIDELVEQGLRRLDENRWLDTETDSVTREIYAQIERARSFDIAA